MKLKKGFKNLNCNIKDISYFYEKIKNDDFSDDDFDELKSYLNFSYSNVIVKTVFKYFLKKKDVLKLRNLMDTYIFIVSLEESLELYNLLDEISFDIYVKPRLKSKDICEMVKLGKLSYRGNLNVFLNNDLDYLKKNLEKFNLKDMGYIEEKTSEKFDFILENKEYFLPQNFFNFFVNLREKDLKYINIKESDIDFLINYIKEVEDGNKKEYILRLIDFLYNCKYIDNKKDSESIEIILNKLSNNILLKFLYYFDFLNSSDDVIDIINKVIEQKEKELL